MSLEGLSVVIPVWGEYARWLPPLRAHLQGEGVYLNKVILVVNQEPALASRLSEEWPESRVLESEQHLSVGALRNLGLGRVKSEWVCFMDADDLSAPGMLSRLLALARAQPDLLLVSGLVARLREDGRTEPYPWPPLESADRRGRLAWVWQQWRFNQLSLTTGTVVRTSALRRLGGFPDAGLAEDGMLGCALVASGRIQVLPEVSRLYRTHAQGLCQRGHSARVWRRAYRQQRVWLRTRRSLPAWRYLSFLLAPLHWFYARRLARVARYEV